MPAQAGEREVAAGRMSESGATPSRRSAERGDVAQRRAKPAVPPLYPVSRGAPYVTPATCGRGKTRAGDDPEVRKPAHSACRLHLEDKGDAEGAALPGPRARSVPTSPLFTRR